LLIGQNPIAGDRDHRRLASIAMEGTGKVKGMFQQSTMPNVAGLQSIPATPGHIRLVAKAVLPIYCNALGDSENKQLTKGL